MDWTDYTPRSRPVPAKKRLIYEATHIQSALNMRQPASDPPMNRPFISHIRLKEAPIRPSNRQGTLSGGADEMQELTWKPSALPEAADQPFPFLELAQKVERLERVVQDLQGWREACAGQPPAPPAPDAAVIQRPVPGSPPPHQTSEASGTLINDSKSQSRPHDSSAIIQPVGHNHTAGVLRVANGRWTDAATKVDNEGGSPNVKQDAKMVQHAKNDTAAVAASAPIANDFQDAPPALGGSGEGGIVKWAVTFEATGEMHRYTIQQMREKFGVEQVRPGMEVCHNRRGKATVMTAVNDTAKHGQWHREHATYCLQSSLWDGALLIGCATFSSMHVYFVWW